MADRSKAYSGNVPGAFFVDQSCIDCGTCYTMAPEVFRDAGDNSLVHHQPDESQRLRASMALLACPTASIGTEDKASMADAVRAFPDPIEDEVHFCGFTSEDSFGAWSYFIRREAAGNVMMDSPRAVQPLMKRLEALGGVGTMVLSHQDDVADHAAFHQRFGCERIMHAGDRYPGLERYIEGDAPVQLDPDLLFIPTPGHTAGSACLLYRNTFLFTGDHLWWNPRRGMLSASKNFNWHSWPQQLKSLERLLDFEFRWVLPGHGASKRTDTPDEMRKELERGLAYLKKL